MPETFADEVSDDDNDDSPERFAELLENYSAGFGGDPQVGDKIEGKIIAIGKDTVFVDTGTKIDGTVDRTELCDADGNLPYAVGDRLALFAIAVSESEIRLSRAISGIGGLGMLQDAHSRQIPVEGKVVGVCKGGFHVAMLQRRAFCPVSQMDTQFVETPETYVGQAHEFLITRLSDGGRNVVVSRRRLLEEKQRKTRKQFLAQVRNGDILTGTVTRIMPYGVFVALADGVEGMVHISQLSWSRVADPAQVIAVGESVTVRIIGMDTGEDGRTKLALSIKQVQEDPWNSVATRFSVGDTVNGTVTRCMDFGAFVEIAPGIEGLVHISEMSFVKRVIKAEDMVRPGQTVAVVIKDCDAERRRISLSMRDAQGDPWSDAAEKFPVGRRVEGVVQRHESFGIFVTLAPGITGLVHQSKIARSSAPAAAAKRRVGENLSVVVEKVDVPARKIALNLTDDQNEDNWQQYAGGGEPAMGTLGEMLKQAMAKKQHHK